MQEAKKFIELLKQLDEKTQKELYLMLECAKTIVARKQ